MCRLMYISIDSRSFAFASVMICIITAPFLIIVNTVTESHALIVCHVSTT